ncbi:hypothetical protein C4580_01500 [Candidatus Woesearchaeota archaeon]|nr:MAG: hypothetical protein C4580_01500 [Candidatus Woesearchaeota archaeon]
MDIREIKECPDCASPNIVHSEEREQIICRECGLIYEPLTPAEEHRFEQAHETETPRKAPAKKKAAKKKAKKKK